MIYYFVTDLRVETLHRYHLQIQGEWTLQVQNLSEN